jgi:hypothetical protein
MLLGALVRYHLRKQSFIVSLEEKQIKLTELII